MFEILEGGYIMNNRKIGILKTIGKELRGIRNSKDISLAEVAEKAGVSTMYISEIERDKKVPSDEVIDKLATIYKVDEKELYEGFGKLTEGMLHEVKTNNDLFSVLYKISENQKITIEQKEEFYRIMSEQYDKIDKL